jgi:hypothetical protein
MVFAVQHHVILIRCCYWIALVVCVVPITVTLVLTSPSEVLMPSGGVWNCTPSLMTARLIAPECYQNCTLTNYVNTFTDGFRFESLVGGLLLTTASIMASVFVPIPFPSNAIGTVVHRLYETILVAQCLCALASLAQFCFAFTSVTRQHPQCLPMVGPYSSMLNLVFVTSGGGHAFVLSNFVMLQVYGLLLLQAERVRSIARNRCDLAGNVINTCVWCPVILLNGWMLVGAMMLVGSWIGAFAVWFVIPLVQGIFLLGSTVLFISEAVHNFSVRNLDSLRGNDSGEANTKTVQARRLLLSSVRDATTPFTASPGIFYYLGHSIISWNFTVFLFYPSVLTWYWLGRGQPVGLRNPANVSLVADIYHHHYQVFTDLDLFALRNIFDVDFTHMRESLAALASNPGRLIRTPEEYIRNAQGFVALNLVLAAAKWLVATTTAVLAMIKASKWLGVSPNVPTSLLTKGPPQTGVAEAVLRHVEGPSSAATEALLPVDPQAAANALAQEESALFVRLFEAASSKDPAIEQELTTNGKATAIRSAYFLCTDDTKRARLLQLLRGFDPADAFQDPVATVNAVAKEVDAAQLATVL